MDKNTGFTIYTIIVLIIAGVAIVRRSEPKDLAEGAFIVCVIAVIVLVIRRISK